MNGKDLGYAVAKTFATAALGATLIGCGGGNDKLTDQYKTEHPQMLDDGGTMELKGNPGHFYFRFNPNDTTQIAQKYGKPIKIFVSDDKKIIQVNVPGRSRPYKGDDKIVRAVFKNFEPAVEKYVLARENAEINWGTNFVPDSEPVEQDP